MWIDADENKIRVDDEPREVIEHEDATDLDWMLFATRYQMALESIAILGHKGVNPLTMKEIAEKALGK
tara:strand:+ start:129 stop:332 length:204 start_codon:yes stop_codon:yes gene_type:complete